MTDHSVRVHCSPAAATQSERAHPLSSNDAALTLTQTSQPAASGGIWRDVGAGGESSSAASAEKGVGQWGRPTSRCCNVCAG